MSLQIADDSSIALVASPRPVVDPDHSRRNEARATAPPHDAQQGIVAHRQHQPLGKARCRAPAQNKPKMMDDIIQSDGSPRPRREDVFVKALSEDAPTAQHRIAVESPHPNDQPNRLAGQRQIRQTPQIPAVDPS